MKSSAGSASVQGFLNRFFGLEKHGTSIRTEVTAGLTTFAAMAYILAVNPQILSATGMDFGAVVTATALASALMTAIFALATNWPIALAPGMGLNAFFTFTICLGLKIPWPAALAMVFVSGLGFFVLSLTGVRRKIVDAIPHDLKIAISCGVGLFIAFIGLKNGGLIVANPATLVGVGPLHEPRVLLVLGGIVLTAVLHFRRVRGGIILAILALTVAGFFIPAPGGAGMLTKMPAQIIARPASLAPTFLALDFSYLLAHPARCAPLILAFLFVDLFDNMGTLIGVCSRLGYLDRDGQLPGLQRALSADACAAMVGSTLGTSTVTSYIESAAGAEVGGRTGLAALVVSACFLAALCLHPLLRIIPAEATAPALVIVGVLMMQSVAELNLRDFAVAVPCVLTMLLMPLTFSISEGLALGFVIYAAFMLGAQRVREVSATAWVLAALFLLHLVWPH